MSFHNLTGQPALLYAVELQGDAAAAVRFFADGHGAMTLRARGLGKPTSKLAPLLKPADELLIDSAAGRGNSAVLTGVRLGRSHDAWRADLSRQSLQWFMVECAYLSSSDEEENSRVFRLVVNLLRNPPADDQLPGAVCAFCLKILSVLGLLPDLRSCAVSGEVLVKEEPAFLLPTREGFVSLNTYNTKYARSSRGFVQLDRDRLPRWRSMLSGALLDYPGLSFDATDAAVLAGLARICIADIASRGLRSADFMIQRLGLASLSELAHLDG